MEPFSQKAFRAYAAGQSLASFGTWVQTITQDWLVLTLTHSAQAVGLTAAFQFLPALLLGTYGGSFADRLPRKPLLVCTQLLNCAVAGGAAVLTLTGQIQPWEIYVLAVAGGLIWVVDNPTRQTLLGDLVPPDVLRSAVAVNASIFQSARIVAPAVASILITTAGSGFAFVVDTAFFAAGLLAWSRVRVPRHIPPASTPSGVIRGQGKRQSATLETFRYLRHRPQIALTITLVAVVGTFGLNFPVVLTVIAADDFHGNADLYGLFNVMLALGSVAGALTVAGRGQARLRQIVVLGAVFGAVELATALMTSRLSFLLLLMLLGFSNLAFQAVASSAVQLWTAPAMRGRVLGLYGQVFVGGTPIGAPLIGALTARCGGRIGMAVCGGVPLVAALVLGATLARRTPQSTGSAQVRPRARTGSGRNVVSA